MKKLIKSFFNKNSKTKIKPKDLAKKINALSTHEYAQLKDVLYNLAQEGYLEKIGKRYSLNKEKTDKLIGTFQISREGTFGFVILKNSNLNDIFIPEKSFSTAFHGDIVEVKLVARQRGKNLEGKIVEVIKRQNEEIIGILTKVKSYYYVKPDSEEIHKDVFVASEDLNGATAGDKVIVGNIQWNSKFLNPEGIIIDNLGEAGTYDTEIASMAHEFNIPYKFPKRLEKELKNIDATIDEHIVSNRLDLRKDIIFTIDPEDAKDFDDAVSVTKLPNGNISVGIHIADVSYYVNGNSKIFEESMKRGNSVYLVGKVIPMLPEKLSNNICSLVPGKDRLTFSVICELNKNGNVVSYKIKKSIINSNRRFTYDEVQQILEEKKGDFFDELNTLNILAKKLRSDRLKTGSINFHTPEVKFELDEKGKPVAVNIKVQKDSHQLIEEFMLLANRIVAAHINKKENKNKIPFVYRIHDQPDELKLREFTRFVNSLGYKFNQKARNKSKEFQNLLDQVEGSEEESIVNEIAIRSMAKALYSTDNIGHYGLGFKFYTHFTSPIRRFPDLIVHLLIDYCLENKENHLYSENELNEICEHCSFQERNAIQAERLSVKLKQIEFLKNLLGEEFHGVISGVMNYGLFVELKENLAEGLIRLRDMEDDFYEHDEKNYAIIGRQSKKIYRLGDRVKVKLIRVDDDRREIDFLIIND